MAVSLRFCPECNFLLKARGIKELENVTNAEGTSTSKTTGKIVYWCPRGEDYHPQKSWWTKTELEEEEGNDVTMSVDDGSGNNPVAVANDGADGRKFVVLRNDIVKSSAASLAVFNADLINDPTMMRTNETQCPNCDGTGAIMFMASAGAKGADGMKLVFICTTCKHKWLA
jgi:DNA-directed RNA polymerase subunit M/transcription elongation factor TFIIS